MEGEFRDFYGRWVKIFHEEYKINNSMTIRGVEGILKRDTEHFIHLRDARLLDSPLDDPYTQTVFDKEHLLVGKRYIVQMHLQREHFQRELEQEQ